MAIQNKQVIIKKLGLVAYETSWALQEALLREVVAIKHQNSTLPPDARLPTENYLLLCEHPPVYTLGRAGGAEHLLVSQAELARQGIGFYVTNRGGDITYHGPGQLVVYAVLDLENFFTDVHAYLRVLEEAVLGALRDFGLEGIRRSGLSGVWLSDIHGPPAAKVCAMGVRVRRWVTMHGLALNVNTDLSYFDQIVPCGLRNSRVTSMAAALGGAQELEMVGQRLVAHLCRLFEMETCAF